MHENKIFLECDDETRRAWLSESTFNWSKLRWSYFKSFKLTRRCHELFDWIFKEIITRDNCLNCHVSWLLITVYKVFLINWNTWNIRLHDLFLLGHQTLHLFKNKLQARLLSERPSKQLKFWPFMTIISNYTVITHRMLSFYRKNIQKSHDQIGVLTG